MSKIVCKSSVKVSGSSPTFVKIISEFPIFENFINKKIKNSV